MGTGNYSATSKKMKLVHWPLMGGLLHIWYSEEGTERGPSPPRPLLAVPNVTVIPDCWLVALGVVHAALVSSQFCLVLPPPCSSSCSWNVLQIYISLSRSLFHLFFGRRLPLWPCGVSACWAIMSSLIVDKNLQLVRRGCRRCLE